MLKRKVFNDPLTNHPYKEAIELVADVAMMEHHPTTPTKSTA